MYAAKDMSLGALDDPDDPVLLTEEGLGAINRSIDVLLLEDGAMAEFDERKLLFDLKPLRPDTEGSPSLRAPRLPISNDFPSPRRPLIQ